MIVISMLEFRARLSPPEAWLSAIIQLVDLTDIMVCHISHRHHAECCLTDAEGTGGELHAGNQTLKRMNTHQAEAREVRQQR